MRVRVNSWGAGLLGVRGLDLSWGVPHGGEDITSHSNPWEVSLNYKRKNPQGENPCMSSSDESSNYGFVTDSSTISKH